jgi:hypothetical protein
MHVHLDHEDCLESNPIERVREFAERGVRHGLLNLTSVEELIGESCYNMDAARSSASHELRTTIEHSSGDEGLGCQSRGGRSGDDRGRIVRLRAARHGVGVKLKFKRSRDLDYAR